MMVTGVPSLADVSTTASQIAVPRGDLVLVAEEEARAREAEVERAG